MFYKFYFKGLSLPELILPGYFSEKILNMLIFQVSVSASLLLVHREAAACVCCYFAENVYQFEVCSVESLKTGV